jgi:hypothetical protein
MSFRSIPPRGPRHPRAALAVLAATAALALPAAPAAAQDGVTFTYRVQSTARGTREEPSPAMLATVRIAGPNARMDFREGSAPGMKDGGYLLLRGAEKSIVIVSPKDKSAMVIGAEGLGSGAGAMTNNAIVKVSTRDQKFDYQDLGAGDRILGYPTRHVRMTWSGATEMRVMGRKSSTTESSVGEAWVATSVAGADAEALAAWSRAFGAGLRRTNPDLASQMAEYDRKFGRGLALRNQVVSTRTDDKGKVATDTMRMEVTELARGRLDPTLFEVPAGYQVADMRQMAASLDSARKANGLDTLDVGKAMKDGMKDAGKDAGKDAAADALKGKLGGFLRKKKP